jgi:tetratricopeptide (TPR) repeat protein
MGDDADTEEGDSLPTFDMGDDAEEGDSLPTFDMGDDAEEGDPVPADASEAVQEAAEDAVTERAADESLTIDDVRQQVAASPSDVSLRQRMVELAYGTGEDTVLAEAFLGLAQTLDESGEKARAQAAYQQVLEADPANEIAAARRAGPASQPVREVAASEDYVDLGAMIFGDDDDGGEKSTRFTVAYEEPSGDEGADFAKMLSQFKSKVSESIDADDVRAHHDLGTAYKEMGLFDEAISEFQLALRASGDHLPTYELLGITFMEIGKPEATVNALERALDVDFEIEDELLGIYYYLARAHEMLGNTNRALELYDKVFSLDINFADVTDRLRALR